MLTYKKHKEKLAYRDAHKYEIHYYIKSRLICTVIIKSISGTYNRYLSSSGERWMSISNPSPNTWTK